MPVCPPGRLDPSFQRGYPILSGDKMTLNKYDSLTTATLDSIDDDAIALVATSSRSVPQITKAIALV